MIVYFSTVVRMAPLENGGELVKLDWDRKEVLARRPIVPREPVVNDPNPRGGTRGGRGIVIQNGHVMVASYHTLHVFDHDLELMRSISHPLFGDLHELGMDQDGLWASSTVLDGALKIDEEGRLVDSWWPREDPVVSGRYQLPPLEFDKSQDNRLSFLGISQTLQGHTHLNAVSLLEGRPIVLLNKLGSIVRLNPTEIFAEDPMLEGSHNLLVTNDSRVLVNDSIRRAVVVFDPSGGVEKRIELEKYRHVRKILRKYIGRSLRIRLGKMIPSFRLSWLLVRNVVGSRPVFVRGLCETGRGTLLVGISPATVLEIDPKTEKLVDLFTYSDDIHCAVHGLRCKA